MLDKVCLPACKKNASCECSNTTGLGVSGCKLATPSLVESIPKLITEVSTNKAALRRSSC